MVLPDKVERRRGLSLALREVPLDLDDRAVLAIYAQASASNAFPVTTFDVLGLVVADRPDLAVLCLLFAGARDASRIWKRMENLLFSWVTVPIAAWLSAIEAYLAWLRRHPEFGPVEERAATWASIVFGETKLESFLHVVHDAAYRALKDVPEPRPENFYVYQAGEFPKGYTSLLERASDELNVRHPEDLWLDESPWAESGGARRRDLPDQLSAIVKAQVAFPCAYRGVVVSTPLVLAVRVVQGSSANCDIEALRQVRDFDSEWFDTAFAFALALTLGDRLKKKEFPFHDA